MTDYLTEQEQIQMLKNWIKEYGVAILVGLVLSIGVVLLWQRWQSYREQQLQDASAHYQAMLNLRADNNSQAMLSDAKQLLHDAAKTPYATMAAFLVAQDAVSKKDYATAQTQLTWVIDHSHDAALRSIARLRLARVLIAFEKPEAALAWLAKEDNASFQGLADEIKGDAYLALHDPKKASQAYQQALREIPEADVTRPLLAMKLAALGPDAS